MKAWDGGRGGFVLHLVDLLYYSVMRIVESGGLGRRIGRRARVGAPCQ
jgi:hypothetical protein